MQRSHVVIFEDAFRNVLVAQGRAVLGVPWEALRPPAATTSTTASRLRASERAVWSRNGGLQGRYAELFEEPVRDVLAPRRSEVLDLSRTSLRLDRILQIPRKARAEEAESIPLIFRGSPEPVPA
jgi:hypothetical protein